MLAPSGSVLWLVISAALVAAEPAPRWAPVGPDGGDVRSLAPDPKNAGRIYLGTAGGALYRSDDSGQGWRRLAPGFPRRDQSLDELIVSPTGAVLIGFWDLHSRGGGVAVSVDQGETFTIGLEGESVRALRLAPSDPDFVVAGSLSGVFASSDGARTWRRITPLDHPELRNVESVAIDPRDKRVIYVGTWHLPWKTTDGGLTWRAVPRGMIDDSDVFTITLDRRDPDLIHATACSGIYRAFDGAGTWARVRGMPFSSRRTRAFAQDAERATTFYAGTTEGLWVSRDDTASWRPATGLDVVVNAIAALQGGVLLVGADGVGVLRSVDSGRTWSPSNRGFSARFVSRVVFDPGSGAAVAGVWGDGAHGGVFVAPSAGGVWRRIGDGLEGNDVLSLLILGSRKFAGTDRGLFVLRTSEAAWTRPRPFIAGELKTARVNDLSGLRGSVVLAATSFGLWRSEDAGEVWSQPMAENLEVTSVLLSPAGHSSLAATTTGLYRSMDEGRTWALVARPGAARINALAAAPEQLRRVFAATNEGFFRSEDGGATWVRGALGLPDSDYTSVAVTSLGGPVFVSDFTWGGIFRSDDQGVSWRRLGAAGLLTDRIWWLGLSPFAPGELLAAPVAGGLHRLVW